MKREDNTEYILNLSYGKDSLACLGAIKELGWPLDRIVHVEVWATDTIPADLPPMVEFKKKADAIIKERFGIEVEHVCAMRTIVTKRERVSFEGEFYKSYFSKKINDDRITGFPIIRGSWCTRALKTNVLNHIKPHFGDNVVTYIGIAADESERVLRHSVTGKALPLVAIGWDEAYCRKWCEENDLLSPIYTDCQRGGCWFCHNQSVDQLRKLRKNYPEYWAILMKWDLDSPVTFKPGGITVHDFDKRFAAEEAGFFNGKKRFLWKSLDNFQYP